MSNLDLQFHLVHLSNSSNLNVDVRLEVSRIILIANESLHLVPEELDVFQSCPKINVDQQLLSHRFRSGDVLNPHVVENNVRYLSLLVILDIFEDRKKQGDMFHDELVIPNIDSVQHVVRMFDEEKYAGTQDFLTCRGKYKG